MNVTICTIGELLVEFGYPTQRMIWSVGGR